jgi:hypothetical protein
MVHQGIDDETQLAVIALMFDVCSGDSASIISSLSSSLSAVAEPGSSTEIASGIDFSDVISNLATSEIQQYSGSLTTPPCAEGVTFLIVKEPLPISVADYKAIKKIVKFNSRFIQNTLGEANMLDVGAVSGLNFNTSAPAQNASAPAENSTVTSVHEATVELTADVGHAHAEVCPFLSPSLFVRLHVLIRA